MDVGMARGELVDDGHQGPDHGGGEATDPHRARRLGVRVQVETGGLDGGEDGDGVVGQPLAGGGEPDPATVGLEQGSPGVAGQGGDLLGDRRGGEPELVGDLAHRSQARQLEQQAEAADVHDPIVHQI